MQMCSWQYLLIYCDSEKGMDYISVLVNFSPLEMDNFDLVGLTHFVKKIGNYNYEDSYYCERTVFIATFCLTYLHLHWFTKESCMWKLFLGRNIPLYVLLRLQSTYFMTLSIQSHLLLSHCSGRFGI